MSSPRHPSSRSSSRSSSRWISIASILSLAVAACAGSPKRSAADPDDAVRRAPELGLAADWERARETLTAALNGAPDDVRARLLVERAAVERELHAYRKADDFAAASASLAEAEPLLAKSGPATRAAFADQRGWITYFKAFDEQATFDDARRSFEEARALREQAGDRRGLAMSHFQIGLTYQQAERNEEARTEFRRGLEVAEREQDRVAQAYIERHLGYVESVLGKDPRIGLPYYERSLALREQAGHRWGVVFALLLLADVRTELGEPAAARELLGRAATVAHELRVTVGLAQAHQALAELDAAAQQTAAACAHFDEAVRAWDAYGVAQRRAQADARRTELRCPSAPTAAPAPTSSP